MSSIKHEVWIDAPQEKVYKLLSSAEAISTWWDKQTIKETSEGTVLEHSPGPEHGVVKFLVLANEPSTLVKWRCISKHPNNTPASEWTGTEIIFRIGGRDSSEVAMDKWASNVPIQTVIKFEHCGWPASSKYFAFCCKAWADVLSSLSQQAVNNAS
ncbi:hypothetical protein [Pelobacter seleniigenes]|uniref:hypothetical protein n=1 Tax=Pelobacter seleniigenes TaxID=407188 RepID=UPI0004A6EAAA|nr:hypothetical protein [Pelobacter seleniigenes]